MRKIIAKRLLESKLTLPHEYMSVLHAHPFILVTLLPYAQPRVHPRTLYRCADFIFRAKRHEAALRLQPCRVPRLKRGDTPLPPSPSRGPSGVL